MLLVVVLVSGADGGARAGAAAGCAIGARAATTGSPAGAVRHAATAGVANKLDDAEMGGLEDLILHWHKLG